MYQHPEIMYKIVLAWAFFPGKGSQAFIRALNETLFSEALFIGGKGKQNLPRAMDAFSQEHKYRRSSVEISTEVGQWA